MEDNSPRLSTASVPQLRFGKIDDLASRVAAATDAARRLLFSQQHKDGYWCGELEADTTLEADYIILHTMLGTVIPSASPRLRATSCSIKTKMAVGVSTRAAPRISARR